MATAANMFLAHNLLLPIGISMIVIYFAKNGLLFLPAVMLLFVTVSGVLSDGCLVQLS